MPTLSRPAEPDGLTVDAPSPARAQLLRSPLRLPLRKRARIERSGARSGLALIALLLIAFFQFHVGGFVTRGNFAQIATTLAPTIIAAIPAARLVIAGNVDLSIAGGFGLMGVVCGNLLNSTHSTVLAIALTLLAGAVMGGVNGALVRILKISPIIVTLALGSVYLATALITTNGNPLGQFPDSFTNLALTKIAGISVPILTALLAFALGAFALTRTVAGMHSYAIGGSPQAARLAGVRVDRHVFLLYVYMGLSVGLLSIITDISVSSASPNNGVGFEINVLTAVILGGVAFQGGGGRWSGIFVGVVTMGILQAGFVFEGLNSYYQTMAQGLLLLTALAADQVAAAYKRRVPGSAKTRQAGPGVPEPIEVETSLQRARPVDRGTTPRLKCSGLTKAYGPVIAVQDIDITAYAGEVTCLLGDNGAGKSTLIKMLSGVVTPDSGTITLDGQLHAFTQPSEARAVGVETVYQELALSTNLGAALNLVLGAEPRRLGLLDLKQSKAVAESRLAALGTDLDDYFRPVAELSGGQRQSVAIARVVVNDVKVVILDEPTAALGVRQTANVLRLARSLAEVGAAVIMITHDVDSVKSVGDHLVVLNLGRVVFDGPASSIDEGQMIHLMAGYGL